MVRIPCILMALSSFGLRPHVIPGPSRGPYAINLDSLATPGGSRSFAAFPQTPFLHQTTQLSGVKRGVCTMIHMIMSKSSPICEQSKSFHGPGAAGHRPRNSYGRRRTRARARERAFRPEVRFYLLLPGIIQAETQILACFMHVIKDMARLTDAIISCAA